VDPSVFEPPADYATLGPGRSEPMRDDDDNLLQFAIQQSLLDAGTESDQVPPLITPHNTRSDPPDETIQQSLLDAGTESDQIPPMTP
jgi:hypothetical protein